MLEGLVLSGFEAGEKIIGVLAFCLSLIWYGFEQGVKKGVDRKGSNRYIIHKVLAKLAQRLCEFRISAGAI